MFDLSKTRPAVKDPLFGAALSRRTSRAVFDQKREVADSVFAPLADALAPGQGSFFWTRETADIAKLKSLCREAWEIEAGTPRTHHESTRLMRIGEKEINENPDGISFAGPVMEGASRLGVITRDKINDQSSTAYTETIKFYNGLIDSAMAFGWLTSDGNSRTDQLNIGAGWVRMNMAAALTGLSMHPLSQALQEFPEMAGPFAAVHEFAGVEAPGRVQGLFRFGYAKTPPPAPRWPLASRIIADA